MARILSAQATSAAARDLAADVVEVPPRLRTARVAAGFVHRAAPLRRSQESGDSVDQAHAFNVPNPKP
jgi:hypothetical protein